MITIVVSEEIYERLEGIVENGKRNYPGYGHLTNTVEELAESYLKGAINRYDENKRLERIPFRPLHGQ